MSTSVLERAREPEVTRAETTGGRGIERRRGLPRGRAVVGGFLIALAAVGVFAVHRRAEAPPSTSYAVAARALAPGQVLAPEDLRLVPLDLPPAQAVHAYPMAEPLIGAVATHALAVDQLVVRTDVRETDGYRAPTEVSFPVAASRALGGSLKPGERVDVVATFGTGVDAYTITVVRGALVLGHASGDGFAGGESVDVRLGVDAPGDAMALAHAVTVAELFLVRAGAEADVPDVYRPLVGASVEADGRGASAEGVQR